MPWQCFWIAFAVSAGLTPLVIVLARRLGFVARPREDRWFSGSGARRRAPVLMGGVGIFLTLAIGAALSFHWDRQIQGVAAGAVLMFAAGLVDDLRGLRPHLKMAAQTAAACVLLATGTTITRVPIPWIAALAVIFWVIIVTNAVNLIDNMDGLASGVVLVSALTMAFYGVHAGTAESGRDIAAAAAAPATLGLLIAGACAGFLIYNYNPAELFMGDCGSMLLGFLMSAAALLGPARTASHLVIAIFVPVVLLAVPVFDAALVSVVRRLNGRPISLGGRDHTSHRLVALGLSERATVGLLYAISAAFGLLAIASQQLPLLTTLVLAALMFGALALFGVFLGRVQVYSPNTGRPEPFEGRGTLLGGTLLHKKQAVLLLLDVGLVPVSLIAANLLRFEGSLPSQILAQIAQGLPYVITAKILSLAFTRSYQGIWRYAGVSDVLAALKGSTMGSLLAAAALAAVFHLEGFSRTALIIDWMVFTGLALLARTGLVLFEDLFDQYPEPGARRVVVVGADESGLAAIQELKRLRNGASAIPVALVDEDPAKRHRRLAGVPVVGGLEELPEIVRRWAADSVVIAVSDSLPSRTGQGDFSSGSPLGRLGGCAGSAGPSADLPDGEMGPAERAVALCEAHQIPHQRWVGLVAE
jgi:UDP-GlcNAc:undecaprenyl-phosphate GlcNAc-1-phosphate transferase